MSIDWSKAPEGATHAGIIPSRKTNVWYRDIDPDRGRYKYFSLMDESWNINSGRPIAKELIPRPAESAPAAPTWDGQGLPPVGVECEYRHMIWPEYRRCEIRYISDESLVAYDNGQEQYYRTHDMLFRPLRTPEQIAAEEREKAIEEMCFAEETLTVKQAKALYEAGYRRQESST
ncbi:hypothetical protein [Pseudomonas aeruginosa]|uniref:hypothetical protein n=1 Tax=Pseudomonas aeruginosa TaxID=287 RepID=UPI000447E7C6|nr:hypothetical protein [Pseudomonas aeruginosa]KAJ16550.1 hypothetical protein M003_30600 [Pseudomonas aeruginosa IGB83]